MQGGEERTVRVQLSGGLDISRRDEIARLLPDPRSAERVVIDCTAADCVDSTIIMVFMRYRRNFMAAGGDPVNIVIVVQPNLRRVLEIAGLTRSMTIVSAPPPASSHNSGVLDIEKTNGETV